MKELNKTNKLLKDKNNEIGNNIKKYRLIANFSQDAFAEKVFSTKSTISKWESGNIIPSIDMLKIIAKSLGVSVYDILGEKQPISNKIFNWIGKALLWGFVWVHIDITFTWIMTTFGFALMLIGVLSGLGGFGTYLTWIIINNNTDAIKIAILFGCLIWIPLLLLIFGGIGLGLYFIGRQVFTFSLKFFWRNKNVSFTFKEIYFLKRINKKTQIVFWVLVTIGLIYLITLCSIDGTQNNWKNFRINF